MRHCVLAPVLLTASIVMAMDRPLSLCRNGGFERSGMWRIYAGKIVAAGGHGKCLRFGNRGSAIQDVLARPGETLTAAVDVRVDNVKPEQGKRGYAYAAVYQTDGRGNLVEFRDFIQPTGTKAWQRHSYTFKVHPGANFISLRCGIFQGTGTARFDNWTLVRGESAMRFDEVVETGRQRRDGPGVAAILNEPSMPVVGAGSKPETIAGILGVVGIKTELVSAEQLADPMALNPSKYDLVVIPTGQSFPAQARRSFTNFLRMGGDFISMGGYAFNNLLIKHDGQWLKEEEVLKRRLDEAMSQERSLLPDGGFESSQQVPIHGATMDGQWHRNSERCTVVTKSPREGMHCAKVVVPPGAALGETKFWMDLPAERQGIYKVSGWLKTQDVSGRGFAYVALYQYAADGKPMKHKDFVTRHGTSDWSHHTYAFSPEPGATRIHIKFGLYLAQGTAWFDDIRLGNITGLAPQPLNTGTGEPRDGLVTTPAQIGIFDASFPLKRVSALRTARGQRIVPSGVERRAPLKGWTASGVVGYDNARWIPLLQTYDRYDRPRGAAAAVMLNYNGFYSNSSWAYFGIETVDLFADARSEMASVLQSAARFLLRESYLHNLTASERLYLDGEAIELSVEVANRGVRAQRAKVRFLATADPLEENTQPRVIAEEEIVVNAETDVTVRTTFAPKRFADDLYEARAVLTINGEPVDEMSTGFVVERREVMSSASDSLFVGNYFTRGGRPVFLFGSDTYSYTYKSAHENPLTWAQDHRAARDVGLNVYENLQYSNPGHQMADSDWRALRAMAQLTQKHNLVFMPGMLIGHNVATGDPAVAEQSAQCKGYAQHLRDVPALHYYINGDYQMRLNERPEEVRQLWNRWLDERYGSTDKLRATWGKEAVAADLGSLPFPPPNSGRWDDVATVDKLRFQCWLTRRWNQAHVAAIRPHDSRHAIMSEYYSRPFAGIDLRMTIDSQDVSDIGYFDKPVVDIDMLPLKIRWNDLRARGKGVTLGEYGVKTHPAWATENGGRHYHIVRTEEEQKQLFLTVAHYALGMGVSKIQNWCLRDAQTRVFPWGIFYPNQLIPKDVAYVHRNESIIWRHFSPRYVAPPLTVCIANNLRLGNLEHIGSDVGHRVFADLLALHYDFNVVDDHHLDSLPATTKVLIYPSPFAIRDDAYERLLVWVRAGGRLLVTGDVSYDAGRQATRRERLRELVGADFVETRFPNIERNRGKDVEAHIKLDPPQRIQLRPCITVQARDGEVVGNSVDGAPVLIRNSVGRGQVYWCADPVELATEVSGSATRRPIYRSVLRALDISPLSVQPNAAWLHVMAQPTAKGMVHVLFNTKLDEGQETGTIPTRTGRVALRTRNRWPALVAVTDDGRVVAVNAYGEATVEGDALMGGRGLMAVLSLDGLDLRESKAMLVGPFDTGRIELPSRPGQFAAAVGEFQGGDWVRFEEIDLSGDALRLDIDVDRATCMILICERSQAERWAATLSGAMKRPEEITAY